MKIQKSYYIEEEIVNEIIKRAEKENRSESQMLQLILENCLEAKR